jgi:hypothetical protein
MIAHSFSVALKTTAFSTYISNGKMPFVTSRIKYFLKLFLHRRDAEAAQEAAEKS